MVVGEGSFLVVAATVDDPSGTSTRTDWKSGWTIVEVNTPGLRV